MKTSFRGILLPSLAAALVGVAGRARGAEPSPDGNPGQPHTEQQPLALDPVIVRDQPQGVYAPPASSPAWCSDSDPRSPAAPEIWRRTEPLGKSQKEQMP